MDVPRWQWLPIDADDFRRLDLFKRGADDIPSVVSLREPDALDKADAVKRGGLLVQCFGKPGPVGYDVAHIYP